MFTQVLLFTGVVDVYSAAADPDMALTPKAAQRNRIAVAMQRQLKAPRARISDGLDRNENVTEHLALVRRCIDSPNHLRMLCTGTRKSRTIASPSNK